MNKQFGAAQKLGCPMNERFGAVRKLWLFTSKTRTAHLFELKIPRARPPRPSHKEILALVVTPSFVPVMQSHSDFEPERAQSSWRIGLRQDIWIQRFESE